MTSQTHILKTWPKEFDLIWAGDKLCEVRKNDRDYQVGDSLVLRRWNHVTGRFTGRCIVARVSCITREPWLPAPLIVMSLQDIECSPRLTCPCETEIDEPGPHIPSCPYNDPNYDQVL